MHYFVEGIDCQPPVVTPLLSGIIATSDDVGPIFFGVFTLGALSTSGVEFIEYKGVRREAIVYEFEMRSLDVQCVLNALPCAVQFIIPMVSSDDWYFACTLSRRAGSFANVRM